MRDFKPVLYANICTGFSMFDAYVFNMEVEELLAAQCWASLFLFGEIVCLKIPQENFIP